MHARRVRLLPPTLAVRPYALGVLLVLLIALAVRVWLLERSGWMIDFDEAIVGIAGQRILKGDRPFFFYGQPYMGALESYFAAAAFYIFGVARWTLKLVPLVGCLALAGVSVWVGRLTSGPAAGLLAGLFVAVAPVYITVNELRALGGYIEVMFLGMTATGFALLLVRFPSDSFLRTAARHLALGLAIGLGVWVNWLIAYYAVPIALFLLSRIATRSIWTGLWASALGFLLGSSPLWVYNIEVQGESFNWLATEAAHAAPITAPPSLVLQHALDVILPLIVGANQPWGVTPDIVGVVAWGVSLAGIGALVLLPTSGRATQRATGYGIQATDFWVIFLITGLAIYATSTFGQTAITVPGVDYTGRYLVPLAPGIAIAAAHLIARARAIPAVLRAGVATSYVLAMGWGIMTADPGLYFQSPYYPYLDLRYERVIEYLDARGIRDIWTDIGLGRVLSFETEERIRSADYLDLVYGAGIDRLPDHTRAVKRSARTAYVVVILTNGPLPIEQALEAQEIAYQIEILYPYAVVIPERIVQPEEIAAGLGPQVGEPTS